MQYEKGSFININATLSEQLIAYRGCRRPVLIRRESDDPALVIACCSLLLPLALLPVAWPRNRVEVALAV
ncbi:MAG: hypothetical protein ACRCR1_04960 [Aeromonas sp.]